MDVGTIKTIVSSLLSALVSAFLASYLTYWFTERSWRRRRHLEDIKTNCLNEILRKIEGFERFFEISEGKIAGWVRSEIIFKKEQAIDWYDLFSFGFEKPPTTHYLLLLHDLKNHFPELEKELKEFEIKMKELCREYKKLISDVTKVAYSKARNVIKSIPGLDIMTEVVVMRLADYEEWYYPNDARTLKNKGVYKDVDKIVEDLNQNYAELVKKFLNVRKTAISIIKNVKKKVVEALHTQELPGKCKLL